MSLEIPLPSSWSTSNEGHIKLEEKCTSDKFEHYEYEYLLAHRACVVLDKINTALGAGGTSNDTLSIDRFELGRSLKSQSRGELPAFIDDDLRSELELHLHAVTTLCNTIGYRNDGTAISQPLSVNPT
ncbi:hypothetical protein EVAR_70956_1 [Eumeta japonica]|uniref:Uncharacterized protein n=1 Tax=Eumeta variegata TaxID=151549 RepID=A0A4C1SRK3_EUMVA|nr:hypothetical protein EVAR_70956_1 [Eumeta japonica]